MRDLVFFVEFTSRFLCARSENAQLVSVNGDTLLTIVPELWQVGKQFSWTLLADNSVMILEDIIEIVHNDGIDVARLRVRAREDTRTVRLGPVSHPFFRKNSFS